MNSQNHCFNAETLSVLSNLIGKNLHLYRCDPFNFSTTVYENVGFSIDDKFYLLTNDLETMDYFGDHEDVAVLRFESFDAKDTHSCLGVPGTNELVEQVDHYVDDSILRIDIVNEIQQVFTNGIQTDEICFTRGIVFYFKDREIAFEKSWDLSKFIIITQGENLIGQFQSTEKFCELWHAPDSGICRREIITIS